MLSALFRRKIMEPLQSVIFGSIIRRYWLEIEKTQYKSYKELLKIQQKRLQSIIEYAYQNNHFYKERFNDSNIDPYSLSFPDDIKRIPIVTKNDIRRNKQLLISDEYSIDSLLHFKTGGSTGKALDIFITEECSEMRFACARRHDRWAGWEPGEPIGAVWGNPELPKDLKQKLKNWLLYPVIYLDTMQVTNASVIKFAKEWNKTKPSLLFGHAHSIYILAQYIKKLSIEEITPKGIISSSMMLLPNERKVIENVFGIRVTDRYGCEEVSLIASECERHDGMHLNIEHLYIEFLNENGGDAKPGEEGMIIVTDLMNKAMPFIRYKVEDVGVPLDRLCPCGRGLPLMDKVTGRVADFLIKKDGTKVAGVSLIENTLTKIPGIDQMQIVQKSLNLIMLNIVAGRGFDEEKRQELISYFEDLLGNETKIELNFVPEIKPDRTGKFRFSICKVINGMSASDVNGFLA